MAYVEDGLYLWECDVWEAPRPIAVKEGWATGQDINLPADWIDHGTLTPLIAQAQAEPMQADAAWEPLPDDFSEQWSEQEGIIVKGAELEVLVRPLQTFYDSLGEPHQRLVGIESVVVTLPAHLRLCRRTTAPSAAATGEAVPTIVCLCGSTRFWRQFQISGLEETLAGKIVLSIGSASGTDEEHFGHLTKEEHDKIVDKLNELHFRKIEMADEVLILNCNGYIGQHTAAELAYARKLGKTVRFLEPERERPSAQDGD